MKSVIELAKENCPYHSEEMRGAYYDGFVRAAALVRAEALAEPELNLNCKSVQARLATVWGYVKAEAVKQEPIAWACIDADGSFMDALDRKHGAYQTPLYAAPAQPVQEPEYWEVHNGVCPHGVYRTEEQAEQVRFDKQKSHDLSGSLASFCVRPLYAAPLDAKAIRAEREWVDLTDDEIFKLGKENKFPDTDPVYFASAVIAAFKEKQK